MVDSQHDDILVAVQKAAAEAEKQAVTLSPSVYIWVLEQELERLRKERVKRGDPMAGNAGGWILDSFPNTIEQLNAMMESNLLPDTFFFLQDNSDESAVITRRWFNSNRDVIENKINKRLAENRYGQLVFVMLILYFLWIN